jgi:neutral ceramidase
MSILQAGAAAVDISPRDSQFLFGYPHVERFSTGIHDPLYSSALYLSDGTRRLIFVANDIIFVSRESAARVRRAIADATGVPDHCIMVSATHTHSGPKTTDYVSNDDDLAVPKTDPAYLRLFEDGIFEAAVSAYRRAGPAEIGLVAADGTGVGTNRRDPKGPADPEVPVLTVRSGGQIIACMVVYSMHPTVLHEDSRLVTGDFPGLTRRYLQRELLGSDCPVLYHTGPAGNQSVRYVTRANNFAEAERLGSMLGERIARVIPATTYRSDIGLAARQAFLDLPRRAMPTVAEAETLLARARQRLADLGQSGAPPQVVRRAEVDWFGAEETVTLAQAAADGRLEAAYQSCLPAEVQAFTVGPWTFAGWPGEIFVEYALAVKARCPQTYVISLANGELQGYIATEEAGAEGGYETTNAIFAPQSGRLLQEATLALLEDHQAYAAATRD